MRKLIDQANINPADSDYPKGRTRDKDSFINGSIFSDGLIGDMIQFFQKLIIDAGIVENDSPDNATNGYQLLQACDNRYLKKRAFEIGEWNMVVDSAKSVVHPFNKDKIMEVSAIIRPDSDSLLDKNYPLNYFFTTTALTGGSITAIKTNAIDLHRVTGGQFDSNSFNMTAFNRGWVVITYID